MKPILFLFIALLCGSFFPGLAQDNLEDVVYLKSGSVYRGLIIEQVPGELLKIQIAGGSVVVVPIADVQKMTKEQRWQSSQPEKTYTPAPQGSGRDYSYSRARPARDSSYIPHYKKKRTYFFLGELRGGPRNGGIRIVNGYKFGRFGFLGVGVGIDGASFSSAPFAPYFEGTSYSDGIYLPLYLRYSGDIIKKRITPFYYLEMGYAAHPTGFMWTDNEVRSFGGPMGALGFGCKFNTNRRVNFNVNLNVNWKSNIFRGMRTYYDPFTGFSYTSFEEGMDGQLFGCIGFGIGF